MKTTTFVRKLKKLIDESEDFVTDTIPMEDIKISSKIFGFDDVIYVAGEDHTQVFILHIQKI